MAIFKGTVLSLKLEKITTQQRKLEWEIVKYLIKINPGHDFGITPKDLSEAILNNGYDVTAIEIGHTLKSMGFREVMRRSDGRKCRAIRLNNLKRLEYLMLADNDEEFEKIKPLVVYLYQKGYNPSNESLRKIHDGVAEPLRHRAGKWFCESTPKDINSYLEKCKAENLIPKKILELYK